MLNLISNAESAYWDVVAARENLKVAEGARNVAAEFLKLSQKQLELGAAFAAGHLQSRSSSWPPTKVERGARPSSP